MIRLLALVSVIAVCSLAVSGCTDEPPTPSLDISAGRAAEGVSRPALTRSDDEGAASAVGTLVYRRDQGGFFGLADMTPSQEPSTDSRILVILVQGDGSRAAPDLAPLVGAYCSFSGTLRDEATTTPVPELIFETYRVLVPVPEP